MGITFFKLYILFPLIGIVVGGVMFFVGKRTGLLKGKKEIIFFLLSCLLLSIPALLGFIDYYFMPYAYIVLSAVYLLLGMLYLRLLKTYIDDWDSKPYYAEILCVAVVMIVGAMFFSLIFNLCNELQYGWWACTCLLPFMIPSLFRKAYNEYLAIPAEVYAIWSYWSNDEKGEKMLEDIDYNKIIVVELELFKQIDDVKPFNVKVKASENMSFGAWFKKFIDDYNKKSPSNPIAYTGGDDSYGWIFYVITSVLGRKKHINPIATFGKNKIKEHNVIIAKRVVEQKNTEKG